MAVKFYRMNYGMKQHPQTFEQRGFGPLEPGQLYPGGYRNIKDFQLLYSGDVFACEESLIEKPKEAGGWQDRKEHPVGDGVVNVVYLMDVASPLANWTEGEVWTMRDEPSQIIGINISEADYAKKVAQEEAESSVVVPVGSASKDAPDGTRPTGLTPSGPAKVKRS